MTNKESGEEALRQVMWDVGHTNNGVTRYIADAVANQVVTDERRRVGWKPIAEQLPEEDGDYLVAMITPEYLNGQPYTNWLCWCRGDQEWTDTDGVKIQDQDTVTAWMPIPYPYVRQ